jgi:tRNA U34 5-methylaminomethyl-2-thiouridine-forming methyltransferase MnmC
LGTIKIIATNDGSSSLYNEALDETYHSRHGALQESMYVFIEHGLNHLCNSKKIDSVAILEVGFGTGLNALLTLQYAIKYSIDIRYTSLETHPVTKEVWTQLNYSDTHQVFNKMHEAPWGEWSEIVNRFSLKKIKNELQLESLSRADYDLIYFDAFAPNKQPEMWELSVLSKITDAMNTGAVFVTYCAKGQLKRDLKSLGLVVESLPGPPGKREMVRATKP